MIIHARRRTGRRRSSSETLILLSLFLVALTTFLQIAIDYLQSMSIGAYQPTWQRILLIFVLILSLIGLFLAYQVNSKSKYSPIP